MSQVLQCTQFCALICSRGRRRRRRRTRRRRPGSSAARARVDRRVHPLGHARVAQLQVRRLVLLVVGVRQEHRGQPVEGQLAVGLRVVDRLGLGRPASASRGRRGGPGSRAPCRAARRCRAPNRPWPATGPSGRPGGCCAPRRARPRARLCCSSSRIGVEHGRLGPALQRRERRLGRDHAGLHRRVRALDLGHVEEARGVADQRTAGEDQLRDRLEAALVQRARAVGDPLAALEDAADRGMGLEALQLLERRQLGVRVVEPDDEADRDQVLAEHVEPGAAIGVGSASASRWCGSPGP